MEETLAAKKMMHIGVDVGEIGRYVFLPGKVERAALIAEHFDNPRKLAYNREYVTYTGTLEGVPVAVTSTGIGGPSTGIAVEELHECGADTMIRIGSCASTSEISRKGDVIIPRAAIRMEGTGDHYLPIEFPALPDHDVFRALEQAAKQCGFPHNTGITITKDSFYTEVSPETKPVYPELKYKWDAYEKGGATNTCMECSLLFLAGASLKIRTAAVMICGTNFKSYSNDFNDYPENWEDRAVIVGIAAMRAIIRRDLEQEKK
jgi:uridine phosphorylase